MILKINKSQKIKIGELKQNKKYKKINFTSMSKEGWANKIQKIHKLKNDMCVYVFFTS